MTRLDFEIERNCICTELLRAISNMHNHKELVFEVVLLLEMNQEDFLGMLRAKYGQGKPPMKFWIDYITEQAKEAKVWRIPRQNNNDGAKVHLPGW